MWVKASGIVIPRPAIESGAIPPRWRIKSDNPEGPVDLANLDYDYCPVNKDEAYIDRDRLLKRASEVHAIGSLGFAAELVKAQDAGMIIFPVEMRHLHFIMPLTVVLSPRSREQVAYFHWEPGQWVPAFHWVNDRMFFMSNIRLVRRAKPLA